MNIQLDKIIGLAEDGWWMQVHDFTPQDPEKLSQRGRLILTASFCHAGPASENLVEGKEVLMRFQELYYGNLQTASLEHLLQVTTIINKEFEGVELIGAVVIGESLHLVGNNGGIWAQVGDKEGWLINANTQYSVSGIQYLAGKINDGQRLVLGNSKFWECFPLGMLRSGSDAETLTAAAHGGDKGKGVVGVILKVSNIQYSIINNQSSRPKFNFHLPKLPNLPKWSWGHVFITNQDQDQARKRTAQLGIGFLIILLTILAVGIWRQHQLAVKNSLLNQRLESLTTKFSEAQALLGLNPERSRTLIAEVTTEIAEVQKIKGSDKDKRFQLLKSNLITVADQINGLHRVQTEEILDLSLIREGIQASKMRMQDGNLLVLDTSGGRILAVDPVKKNGKVIIGELQSAQLLATYPGKTMVLTDKGIIETPDKLQIKKDWDKVLDMTMFAGNVYLLTTNGIYRYQVADKGFSVGQKWNPDSGQSMVVDGSIWLMAGNVISKYTRGEKENFAVSGLDKDFGDKSLIYTTEDTQKLYVLDPQNSRVVAIKKTGDYDSQYLAVTIKTAVDFVVDEKASQIYLLVGSKIETVKL